MTKFLKIINDSILWIAINSGSNKLLKNLKMAIVKRKNKNKFLERIEKITAKLLNIRILK